MNLIVAVDENWGIGCNGDLLFHLKEDMKFFKEKTLNGTVIMGRKTLDSLPKGQPLKDRINIVLTREGLKEIPETVRNGERKMLIAEGRLSLNQVLKDLGKNQEDEDLWVIGGASVYTKLLPFCQKAYITKIQAKAQADKFIPDLDKNSHWELKEQSEIKEENGISFSFCTYENRKVLKLDEEE